MVMRAITSSPPAAAIPAMAPVLICDFLPPGEEAPDTEHRSEFHSSTELILHRVFPKKKYI